LATLFPERQCASGNDANCFSQVSLTSLPAIFCIYQWRRFLGSHPVFSFCFGGV
jgi:hypothetical protein